MKRKHWLSIVFGGGTGLAIWNLASPFWGGLILAGLSPCSAYLKRWAMIDERKSGKLPPTPEKVSWIRTSSKDFRRFTTAHPGEKVAASSRRRGW